MRYPHSRRNVILCVISGERTEMYKISSLSQLRHLSSLASNPKSASLPTIIKPSTIITTLNDVPTGTYGSRSSACVYASNTRIYDSLCLPGIQVWLYRGLSVWYVYPLLLPIHSSHLYQTSTNVVFYERIQQH